MIGRTISHYRVFEKVGQGGMGEVYLAEDTKLNRKVALKFLPLQYVSDQDLKIRFKREAQAAAALNHPNIITIHEVGEDEGRPYMAMEYVGGGSLKDLIGADKMSVAQVTHLAAQISEGLTRAHQSGIVHRDIKPQNILIDADGRPRICDFGLAKLRREVMLTQTGTTLGTIAYMSPEQARGEQVDHRADIWSLGVVIYEMLTGQRPFKGDHDQAVIYAILNNQPESISGIRPDAPDVLVRIIDKAMAKSPDERYQNVAEMVSELRSLMTELDSQSTKTVKAEREMAPSIAVLPFANLSADKEQEYFCDGMAEDIINALTQVEGLRVVARTSAFAFKGKHQDIRQIGKELSVSSVLEGSVRKASNRVRITAQLINVTDGYHIWSEKFDRDLADIFAIQDEISLAIVEKLRVKLLGDEKDKMLKRYTQNLEAYDLYLKGRYHWNRRTPESIKKAVAQFEQVIEKDPDYALAYAGLADCYSMLEQVLVIPPKEAFPKARELAKKALEIDETLAEAHTSLAFVLQSYDWDWIGMEREFRRAIELNPNYATAHQWFAMALTSLGRTSEAIQEIQKALELDPLSLIINTSAGFVYVYSGQEEKALRQAEKILDMDPTFDFAHLISALVSERRGRYGEAVERYLKGVTLAGLFSQQELTALRDAYSSSGWPGYLRKRLEILQQKADKGYVLHYEIASLHARLDDTKKAIESLEKAYEKRDKSLTGLLSDDAFEKLRSDPRFIEIIKKMRFP
jgi:serine/threonine protein kinase/tetratricopeptide (TPR) repeat protein